MSKPEADAASQEKPCTAKKVPCWVCGGDLLFNYVSLNESTVTIHNYCPRCRKARRITMTVD